MLLMILYLLNCMAEENPIKLNPVSKYTIVTLGVIGFFGAWLGFVGEMHKQATQNLQEYRRNEKETKLIHDLDGNGINERMQKIGSREIYFGIKVAKPDIYFRSKYHMNKSDTIHYFTAHEYSKYVKDSLETLVSTYKNKPYLEQNFQNPNEH